MVLLVLKSPKSERKGTYMKNIGLVLVLVIALFSCGCENSGTARPETELTDLRREIQALRTDMQKVKADLDELKTGTRNITPSPRRSSDTTIYDIPIGTSPVRGNPAAAVTIVEFADMQCPYCIRENPKLNQILQEFPDQVRLVFKHFPLNFHKKALPIHAALELAQQEKGAEAFWQMHDMIMASPKTMEINDLRIYAEMLQLDMGKFDKLMADPEQMNQMLQTDLAEARRCKVRGTPTILINGLKLTDRSVEGYRSRIQEILNRPPTDPASSQP